MAGPVTFVVTGTRREGGVTRGGPGTPTSPIGRVKASVDLTVGRAAADGDQRLEAVPGEDAVVLHIAGGPTLWLHPDHASELLRAQVDPARPRSSKDEAVGPNEVRIPARLQWRLEDNAPSRGATRGLLGDILVKSIDIVTGLVVDKAADFAASKVVDAFDQRVTPGVYGLRADRLTSLKNDKEASIAASSDPALVLVHGTFSETSGTFGKLWTDHPQLVRRLFTAYGGRVYGLDHPTLGASPIANAITLVKNLPDDTRLHLLTHSRGGLVAELLARVVANPKDTFAQFNAKGHAAQRDELRTLAGIVAKKHLKVDRIVRVACPARGTLLASKRLDAYISVVKWALELAGAPVVPQLVDFLGEVVARKADPEMLPGLAAQIPDSPLVQWLHATDKAITGDLRVVAGDLEGDSVISWVKTLLSDAFFWTDNDLVVQTRSMYGGSPRATDSTFVLDQGGKVSHFNYFSNAQTATAIVDALEKNAPDGFRVIGPLSWGGTSATGIRAALPQRAAEAAAALPALFVLPGILGSNLKVGKDRVWLGVQLINGFSRLAYDAKKNTVEPDGPISLFYDDLATYLSNDHDVIQFAFDWRRPIEEEARRLADAVDAALDARKASRKPVRMIAHSMGGIVARTMQIERPDTWNRMMKVDGSRLVMLGTPNGGSFAPMQVLTGDDTFGNVLTAVGAPFQGQKTRNLIAAFPGLLQLQADLLGDLGRQTTWEKLADADLAAMRAQSIWHRLLMQLDELRWGIPSQQVLDRAVTLRRGLDKQRENELAAFAGKLLLVVGKAAFTPAGYELGKEGLFYLDAADQGDGRVTLQSALLPGVATWMLDAEHGSLPKTKDAFAAFRELLNDGTTKRLAPLSAPAAARGAVAGGVALVRSRPARAVASSAPPQRESEILAPAGAVAPAVARSASGPALPITVVNGDLTFIADPLLIGHYRSSKLTGAEGVMDRAIGRAMSASLNRGLYPDAAGTHQIFINTEQRADNPWQLPRPEAVIVAGLGAEGELRGTDLVRTVRQAIIAWGQRLSERRPTPALFRLSTTLLGSGGSGVNPGQAAQLIAQGVREANDQLAAESSDQQRWPRVGDLRIIELYLDRAGEAWRALQTLATASPALYQLTPTIEEGKGSMRRPPDAGYRGAEYDFISALIQKGQDEEEHIVYSLDTKRARSEVRPQPVQARLITNLVKTASNADNDDAQIGRTLFSLLVPVDLEPFMGSSGATVLELDRGTAGIPWELLDNQTPGSGDDRPWAIRTKLLRKLRTDRGSGAVNDASADDSILVIGDPKCKRETYPVLFGARREAAAVVDLLSKWKPADGSNAQATAPPIESLISPLDGGEPEPNATAVMNAAMSRPWRMVHIAGHGAEPVTVGSRIDPRGVVLSDDSFLGPNEIKALRVIPELVFVNCCFLAMADVNQVLKETNYDRATFACGVAEALIDAGVKCVVAAGWAVSDEAAETFAKTFYRCLLNGSTFIDAVAEAREETRAVGGNTWAAYQCYGDPDWKYRRGTSDAQRPVLPPQEFAGIASARTLVLALDTLAVKSEFQGADATEQADRLRYLEESFAPQWPGNGAVAEAFGNAWGKAGNFDKAIDWYEQARVAPDGSASLVAVEQLANFKVRRAWRRAQNEATEEAREAAGKEITGAIALCETLLAVGSTIERESIYGSAYKRLALIERAEGSKDAERDAIVKMKERYAVAEAIAQARLKKDPKATVNWFYPAMQRIAAQLAMDGGVDAETIAAVRQSMAAVPPDFWSVVGQTELDMYESVSRGRLQQDLKSLTDAFRKLQERVKAPRMWASVLDSATFVLGKYDGPVKAGEASAAQALLDTLAELAGQKVAAPVPAPATRTRRAAKKAPKRRAAKSAPKRPKKKRA